MSDSQQGESARAERPEKPKSKAGLIAAIAALVAVVIAGIIYIPQLIAGGDKNEPEQTDASQTTEAPVERVSLKLGVNDAGKTFWPLLVKQAAKAGIDVKIVAFTDYNTPNPALQAGDIDINKFQHVRYLAQYNAANGDVLAPLGSTEIYPISIYSTKWTSLDAVPDGAEVVLSNNPANQVRPLLALQNAGLIKFVGDPGWSATLDDVDYANSKIGKITPVDPTQTAAALASVDLAFVDTPYANAAGLTKQNKLYFEDPDRDDLAQYVNVFAVRAGDETNPAYLKIVEIYQSKELQDAINAEDGGFDGVFKQDSVADLKKVLAEQVQEFSAKK